MMPYTHNDLPDDDDWLPHTVCLCITGRLPEDIGVMEIVKKVFTQWLKSVPDLISEAYQKKYGVRAQFMKKPALFFKPYISDQTSIDFRWLEVYLTIRSNMRFTGLMLHYILQDVDRMLMQEYDYVKTQVITMPG